MVEGLDVTLPCIHKETELIAKVKTELNHIRYFNKNGLHLTTCYFSNMTLQNVTKADEGYYKCSISEAGESPESWLAVSKLLKVIGGIPAGCFRASISIAFSTIPVHPPPCS
ncbi:hypothetical protein CHARACLAT_028427 [Characodon lateralis]|uniref:Ig-like domain-containing protein n=1 Tax=Characodon lateralis TaxID=208331 RepID=A0ABU7EDL3_9TELE|nr:hypothetical protein [Characodon lateralis]